MCVERGVLLLKINWYNLFRGQHDKYFEQLIPLQERQEPWPDMAMHAISPSSRETEAAESLWLQGHLSIHSEFHSNIVRLKKIWVLQVLRPEFKPRSTHHALTISVQQERTTGRARYLGNWPCLSDEGTLEKRQTEIYRDGEGRHLINTHCISVQKLLINYFSQLKV